MTNRSKAYVLLLVTSIIWGIASPVIKYTLSFIGPFSFLFFRFLITAIIFLPIFLIYNKKHPLPIKDLPKLFLLGLLGTTVCLGFLFVGYQYTTSIDGILINLMAPIMIIIGGGIFLKEEITNQEKIGAVIAFSGSIITVIQPLLEGNLFASKNVWGNILVFLSATSWAVFTLLSKKDYKKHHPLVITCFNFFAGFITIIPFFLIEKTISYQLSAISYSAIPGILYMALFSSVIAYFTYNLGVSLIEASEATVFAYLQPVFAAPLSIFWLGEKITPPFLLGAFLIFMGVFLTEYKPSRYSLKTK